MHYCHELLSLAEQEHWSCSLQLVSICTCMQKILSIVHNPDVYYNKYIWVSIANAVIFFLMSHVET